jgi:predicted Zn-dependent peptidase
LPKVHDRRGTRPAGTPAKFLRPCSPFLTLDPTALVAVAVTALSGLWAPSVGAADPPGSKARPAGSIAAGEFQPPAIFDRIEEYRLDNGMLFLLLPRHDVPTISGRIRIRAGNVDCPGGASGVAHMFEHMAFKGTDRIGTRDIARERIIEDSVKVAGQALANEMIRHELADTAKVEQLRAELDRLTARQEEVTQPDEFPRVYDRYSYNFNAWTSRDFTEYESDIPSNSLEVWMLMESERLQYPSFRGFYPERDVVREEEKEGLDNPSGVAWDLLFATAYLAHPYRLPVIGYGSDLEVLTQEAAEAFNRTYYAPGNAVAALVGDFDPTVAKEMIRDYFGDIPAGPPAPELRTVEPAQKGMRRATLRQGTEPELFVAFHVFAPTDPRSRVVSLLADVLSRDITSRLDQRLDIKEKAAREVWASSGSVDRYPGLLIIHASPLEGFTNEQVEQMIWEELERVVTDPVSPKRLAEIKASRRKRFYRSLATNANLAERLTDAQAIFGDWRAQLEALRESELITVEEVTAMARDLFQRDLATVILVEPAEQAAAEEGGAE